MTHLIAPKQQVACLATIKCSKRERQQKIWLIAALACTVAAFTAKRCALAIPGIWGGEGGGGPI